MDIIKIGGKEFTVQFGIGAIKTYCEELDCDLEGLDWLFGGNVKSLSAIPVLVYAGIKNASEYNLMKHGVKTDYVPLAEVNFMLDGATFDEFEAILGVWRKTQYMGKTIESYYFKEEEEEPEEEAAGTKKKKTPIKKKKD